MASVTVEIPDEVLASLQSGGNEPDKTLRLAAAFSLCKQGRLSTSQAARLAGLSYADFLEAAAQAKVELFPVDLEELKEEIGRGYTLGRERISRDLAGPSGTT
jgi:predicted HTH domain antitoxin